jgi:hypothetical protein
MSVVDDILGVMPGLGTTAAQQYVKSNNMTPADNAINSIAGVAGNAIGNAILPGIGGAIGGKVLPMVTGAVESIIGGSKRKKAANSLPGAEDPMERRRLTELDNQRKSFETGSAYASQKKELKNVQSNTVRGAVRAGGGNIGATLSAITRIGADAGDTFAKIAGEGERRMDTKDAMYGDMITKMAERRAALQMQDYTQKMQDAGEIKKKGNQLLDSVLALPNMNQPATPPVQNNTSGYVPPPSSLNLPTLFNPFQ